MAKNPAFTVTLTVNEAINGARLDKAIALLYPDISRTRVKALLDEGHVQLKGIVQKSAHQKVETEDVITLHIPEAKPLALEPQPMALDIIYEDEHILVLNKQAGLTVHPGADTGQDTLVHGLLAHCKDQLSSLGGIERPGIVHRLDRNTTGLMVVAKSDIAHRKLSEQIKAREVKRQYKGICWGKFIPLSGTLNGNINRSPKDRKKMTVVRHGGREAVTHYQTDTLYCKGELSMVTFKLETGRTHQIRVHASHAGHSLLGDPEYGHNQRKLSKSIDSSHPAYALLKSFNRQALHAFALAFTHPITLEPCEFTIPLAKDMLELVEAIES